MILINSLADLEYIKDRAPAHYEHVLLMIEGAMTTKTDRSSYPEDYGTPEYDGPKIAPDWTDEENLESLSLIGMQKSRFVADFTAKTGRDPKEVLQKG